MRLLYLTVAMPYGAGEAFFIPEVHEVIRQGHDLLIVPRSPDKRVFNRDAEGLEKYSLRQPIVSPRILAVAAVMFLTHIPASLHALAMLFRSRNILTLVKNLLVYPKGLWLASVAQHWKADHIHAQWGLTTATIAMIASRVSGIPWSFTTHRGDIVDNNLLAVKTADAAFVRCISESGMDMTDSLCSGHARSKGFVLHLGVEMPPKSVLPTGAATKARTLLCPAHLYPVKGHQYLLQAMAVLKERGVDCRLDVAGEGHLRGQLEDMTVALSIDDRVRFLGQVPHERLLDMLRNEQIGVVVLPSVDLGDGLHEGIPVALIEAMAHGVPVISTPTGGIPELLRDDAGIMARQKEPAALADAIEQLLGDADIRKRYAEAGRRRIENEYSVETIIGKLMEHIENAKK